MIQACTKYYNNLTHFNAQNVLSAALVYVEEDVFILVPAYFYLVVTYGYWSTQSK